MSDVFGGLFKGLSSFMPQDDPDTKLFVANNELRDLQQEQLQIYASIGKKALGTISDDPAYSDLLDSLKVVKAKLLRAQQRLDDIQREKDSRERQQEALRCPDCGTVNPDGVKFCQECGCKLGSALCTNCGANNPPNTRFCGDCGNKL